MFFWLFVPKTLIASSFFEHRNIIVTTILTFPKVLDVSFVRWRSFMVGVKSQAHYEETGRSSRPVNHFHNFFPMAVCIPQESDPTREANHQKSFCQDLCLACSLTPR